MTIKWKPTLHFKRLSEDLHAIMTDRFTSQVDKAFAMKSAIDSFINDRTTTNEELRQVKRLMDGLRDKLNVARENDAKERRIIV